MYLSWAFAIWSSFIMFLNPRSWLLLFSPHRLPLWSRTRPVFQAWEILHTSTPAYDEPPGTVESCERVCWLLWEEVREADNASRGYYYFDYYSYYYCYCC